jgi:hypothetical protein
MRADTAFQPVRWGMGMIPANTRAIVTTPSSDGKAITTIASAHCHGGPETPAIAPGRDHRRTVAGAAGDAMDVCRLNGLGQGHRRQDGGEPPAQHGLARPGRAEEEDVVIKTPASGSRSPPPPGVAGTMRGPVRGHPCDPSTSKLSGSPRSPGRGASAGSSGPAPRRS